MTMPFMPAGLDFSAALRPAIYILRDGRRVVWVGGAKVPASRLHAHITHDRRSPSPRPGLPLHPVRFDSVELRPCRVEDLAVRLAETALELRWAVP